MKKLTLSILMLFAFIGTSYAKNFNMGISGSALFFDASGTETLKDSSNKTSSDESGVAPVGSIFIEGGTASGGAIGLEVIPYSAKLGDGGMTQDDDLETSGTNTVDVNLKNLISLYVENPVDTRYDGSFVRFAFNHGTLETDEKVNTGSSYGDEDLTGLTVGFGVKRDMGNGFYKIIAELSHYQGATFDATNTENKIELDDLQTLALRLSVGF